MIVYSLFIHFLWFSYTRLAIIECGLLFRSSNLPFYALFLISFSGEIIAMRFFITKKE